MCERIMFVDGTFTVLSILHAYFRQEFARRHKTLNEA